MGVHLIKEELALHLFTMPSRRRFNMQRLLFLAALSLQRERSLLREALSSLETRKEITGKEGKMHLSNRRGSCQSSSH